jgi:hypothetical protein
MELLVVQGVVVVLLEAQMEQVVMALVNKATMVEQVEDLMDVDQ